MSIITGMKNKINLIIKYLISLLILAVIFFQIKFENLLKIEINFDLKLYLMIFFTLFSSLMLRALRWHYLMRNVNTRLSIGFSIKLLLTGTALNLIVPAGMGDVLKSYFGYKWSNIKERILAVSIADKLIAIGGLFFISLFIFFYLNEKWIIIPGIFCLIPLSLLILLRSKGFVSFIEYLYKKSRIEKYLKISFIELIKNSDFSVFKIFVSVIISILAWYFTYYILFLSFKCLDVNISFFQVLIYAPVITIVRLFPFTLNGIGSDEAAIIYVYSRYIDSSEQILVAAFIYRIISLIIPALAGTLIIIFNKKEISKAN